MEQDNNIRNLCDTMKTTYDSLIAAKCLENITGPVKNTLVNLSKQTLECSYFIQDYTKYSFGIIYFLTGITG